tara:strand:+ start:10042 stop:10287 length:246 start_codon:yes stop_codon:yes gene_type:complete
MSAKKAKALRKKLGLTNKTIKAMREKDDIQKINPVTKVVYFKNHLGDLVPRKTTRSQVVNRHKYFYRKMKKENKGEDNGSE